jgi:hypothetical protein
MDSLLVLILLPAVLGSAKFLIVETEDSPAGEDYSNSGDNSGDKEHFRNVENEYNIGPISQGTANG